jgi:hypothetical protein
VLFRILYAGILVVLMEFSPLAQTAPRLASTIERAERVEDGRSYDCAARGENSIRTTRIPAYRIRNNTLQPSIGVVSQINITS